MKDSSLGVIKLNLNCVDLAGDLKAGMVLTQLLRHYSEGMAPLPDGEGWIGQTRQAWAYESAVSVECLDRVIPLLRAGGRYGKPFVERKLRRINGAPTLHLRLLLQPFADAYAWSKKHPIPRLPPRKNIDDDIRSIVYARDNYTCQGCGSTENLSVDHRIPRAKNGPDDLSNYRTLCRTCNSKKGSKLPAEIIL